MGPKRLLDRASSGENAVNFVSGDPFGENASFVELGLLNIREDPPGIIVNN